MLTITNSKPHRRWLTPQSFSSPSALFAPASIFTFPLFPPPSLNILNGPLQPHCNLSLSLLSPFYSVIRRALRTSSGLNDFLFTTLAKKKNNKKKTSVICPPWVVSCSPAFFSALLVCTHLQPFCSRMTSARSKYPSWVIEVTASSFLARTSNLSKSIVIWGGGKEKLELFFNDACAAYRRIPVSLAWIFWLTNDPVNRI